MTPPHLTRADYIRTLPTASRRMHRTHFATRTSQFALGRRRTDEAGPFRIQISGTRLEVGNLTSADAADARLRRVDGRRCAAIRDQPRHDRPLARCAGVVCTAAHPGARGHHRRQRLSRISANWPATKSSPQPSSRRSGRSPATSSRRHAGGVAGEAREGAKSQRGSGTVPTSHYQRKQSSAAGSPSVRVVAHASIPVPRADVQFSALYGNHGSGWACEHS